jgi:hypothetical protein
VVEPFLAVIIIVMVPPEVILKEAVGPGTKYAFTLPDVFCHVYVVAPG